MAGWEKPTGPSESIQRLLNDLTRNNKHKPARGIESHVILSSANHLHLVDIRPGTLISAELGVPNYSGADPMILVPGWDARGYLKSRSLYWDDSLPREPGTWYRFAITAYHEHTKEGMPCKNFHAVIFRELEGSEDRTNPHTLTPGTFNLLKDIARGDIKRYEVQDPVMRQDLWWLKELHKKGRLLRKK